MKGRKRMRMPAEIVIRLMVLKHVELQQDWDRIEKDVLFRR